MRDTPPHNLEAEQVVLGVLMLDRDACHRVRGRLTPASFYLTKHGVIFAAACELTERGTNVDLVTLTDYFQAAGKLDDVGASYLAGLPNAVPTTEALDDYVAIVERTAAQRALLRAAHQIEADARHGMQSPDEMVARVLELVKGTAVSRGDGIVSAAEMVTATLDAVDAAMKHRGDVPGVPYPALLPFMDDATGGQFPGEVVVVQGRSSDGKSVLALQCAMTAAKSRGWALLCSNEMSCADYGTRLMAPMANVDGFLIRTGRLSDDDWRRMGKAAAEASEMRLALYERCFSFLQFRAAVYRARARFADQGGLAWVGLDWLQLMEYGDGRPRTDTQNLDAIMRATKELAIELLVPILVVSQPDKASYSAGLGMASGRGSGMIGNIANTLWTIEPWDSTAVGEDVPAGHVGWPTRIIGTKIRMGRGHGRVEQRCWFDAPRARFVGFDTWVKWHGRQRLAARNDQ